MLNFVFFVKCEIMILNLRKQMNHDVKVRTSQYNSKIIFLENATKLII
jgi:hypothetical protein